MKHIPTVFILILNYNGWQDTIECLESVQRLTYPDYWIVVIDNGSTDDSVKRIKSWALGELKVESKFFSYDPLTKPVNWIEYDLASAGGSGISVRENPIRDLPPNRRMVLIQTGANLGYAGGNNVGIRYALNRDADFVWLLNNDTVVDTQALENLIIEAGKHTMIGMVGSKIYYYDRPDVLWFAGGKVDPLTGRSHHLGINQKDTVKWSSAKDYDYVTGCSLLVSRKLIHSIGLMDEAFFLYYEETDWANRARKNGWRIRYQPNSKIWHKVSRSSKLNSPNMIYHFSRSTILYAKKHLGIKLILTTLMIFRFYILPNLLRGKFDIVFAAIRGIVSGVKYVVNN